MAFSVKLIKIMNRCENLTNWTTSGASISLSNDYVEGFHSIYAENTAENDYIQYEFPILTDLSEYSSLLISYKRGVAGWYKAELIDNDGDSMYWEVTFLNPGWLYTLFVFASGTEVGTMDWENVKYFRITQIYEGGYEDPGDFYLDYPVFNTDITSDILAESYIETEMRNHPEAMIIAKGTWVPNEGDIITITDYYTSAGSTTADQIIFEGVIQNYELGYIRKIPCISRAKRDLDEYRPKESLSGDVDSEHLKTLIGNCAYITEGTIDATAGNTSYELKGDKTFRTILNDWADKHKKTWALTPTGVLNFEDPDVDSGEIFFFHKATYDFRDDTVGSAPSGWTDASGAGCTATIIASFDGHKKVLQLYDASATSRAIIYYDFTAITTGTREFYWGTSDNTKTSIARLREGGNKTLTLAIVGGNFKYYDGAWIDTGITATNDSLFHHKIVFDCATDTFDWYIEGTKEITGGGFSVAATNISRIEFCTDNTDTGYYAYYDAIGDIDDSQYTVGDNLKGEVDKVWAIKPNKQVRKVNKVLIYGALVDNVQLEATAEDSDSIEQIGEILYKDTYAMITDQTELNTVATNLLSREAPSSLILSINFWFRYVDKGLYQVGETGWFADLRANPNISPQQIIFRKIKYYFKSQRSYFEVDSGLVFKKNKDESLPQENSLLIQQLADRIHITTAAPTVNDDITLGYRIGYFWCDKTNKHIYICFDNADGAADWDIII